jgi:hypothetical protein
MANLRTITQFKSKLEGGGARPNLFEVRIPTFPIAYDTKNTNDNWNNPDVQEKFHFLCKSAALPASNIGPIDVPFRGRILKVAGDRTFDTWSVTVINDEDFLMRNVFERWMNGITKLDNNSGATRPMSYMANAEVYQLGRGADKNRFSTTNNGGDSNGSASVTPLKTYRFYGIFPTNISQIDLSYESTDTIEEFTVEFQVQYWTTGETDDQTQSILT